MNTLFRDNMLGKQQENQDQERWGEATLAWNQISYNCEAWRLWLERQRMYIFVRRILQIKVGRRLQRKLAKDGRVVDLAT